MVSLLHLVKHANCYIYRSDLLKQKNCRNTEAPLLSQLQVASYKNDDSYK